jgi:hypothetical protein
MLPAIQIYPRHARLGPGFVQTSGPISKLPKSQNLLIFVPFATDRWRGVSRSVRHRSPTYRSALSEAIAQSEKTPIADTTSQRATVIVMMVIFCFWFIKPLGSERRF